MYCYLTAHDFALNVWRHTYFPSNSWRFDSTECLWVSKRVSECVSVCLCVLCLCVCVAIPMWNVQFVWISTWRRNRNHCSRSAVRFHWNVIFRIFLFSTDSFQIACLYWWCIYFDLIHTRLRTWVPVERLLPTYKIGICFHWTFSLVWKWNFQL